MCNHTFINKKKGYILKAILQIIFRIKNGDELLVCSFFHRPWKSRGVNIERKSLRQRGLVESGQTGELQARWRMSKIRWVDR